MHPSDSVRERLFLKTRETYLLVIIGLGLTVLNWSTNEVDPARILHQVELLRQISWLESRWLYAGLLAFTGIFPLVFGFLPQLKFYKVWPSVLLANIPVTMFFMAWDVYFTQAGVWSFSPDYTTGFRLLHIPWEEWMFFIIIPSACIFIYWSLNHVIRQEPFARFEKGMTYFLAGILFGVACWKWDHIYTATTALLTSVFLFWHVRHVTSGYRGRFYLAYLVSCLPFLIVNGVLTGGYTEAPVVMYNPAEYFGYRIGTIPVDDFIYSLLMLLGNITLFEFLQRRRTA